jgi:hypothetical protein
MAVITAILAFITTHWALVSGLLFTLLSLVVALWPKTEGTVGVIRSVLERLSGLQPAQSAGTLKIPGTRPGPRVAPVMEE